MATTNKIIKLVCFDLDGTLADSVPALLRVYKEFLKDYDIEGTQEGFDEINGPALSEIIRILKVKHGLKENVTIHGGNGGKK